MFECPQSNNEFVSEIYRFVPFPLMLSKTKIGDTTEFHEAGDLEWVYRIN